MNGKKKGIIIGIVVVMAFVIGYPVIMIILAAHISSVPHENNEGVRVLPGVLQVKLLGL